MSGKNKNCNEILEKELNMSITFKYTNDTCPYCGLFFENPPKRKKRCPKCKNFIYSRTLYPYGEKILIKEENIFLHKKSADEYFFRKDIQRKIKSIFSKDIKNGICIETKLKNLAKEEKENAIALFKEFKIKTDFGRYRNALSYIGYWFFLNKKYEKAARKFFQVIYLDYNDEIKPENKLFIEYWVNICAKNVIILNLGFDTLKNIFIEENSENYTLLRENGYKKVTETEKVWKYFESFLKDEMEKLQ